MSDLPLTPFGIEITSLVDKARAAERALILSTLHNTLIEIKLLRPSMGAEEALQIAIRRITPPSEHVT